jgi:hypothetical protein
VTARSDLAGKTFALLTAVSDCGSNKFGKRLWLCKCMCGTEVTVVGAHLVSGNTTSCGCQNHKPTHGGSYDAEYRVWHLMRQRCHNPNNTNYRSYGARGITVCERWRYSFQAFIDDMGRRPGRGFQIDRIDNDRGYEPSNCRWATRKQNTRNMRKTIWATIDGDTRSLPEWCEIRRLKYSVIKGRVVRGWTPERAILQPVVHRI